MSAQELTVQLVIMLALVALSAFFSATETAFSSLNRTRLKNMAEHGDHRAAANIHHSPSLSVCSGIGLIPNAT